MPVSSITDVPIDSTISFRSKRADDPTLYSGTLNAICNFIVARGYGTPQATNEAVRQVDPSVTSDYTALTYFIFTFDNGAEVATTIAFADEWIQAGTLTITNQANTVTLKIKDPNQNTGAIISLLASQGYIAVPV